jgi:hypothetical protein
MIFTRPVCRYCGAHDDIVPQGEDRGTWHVKAKCVEAVEPSQKMGGPA